MALLVEEVSCYFFKHFILHVAREGSFYIDGTSHVLTSVLVFDRNASCLPAQMKISLYLVSFQFPKFKRRH